MRLNENHRTTLGRMSRQRAFRDACAAAHALDLVGERWALLVVRELLLGPKRFTDLRAGIPDLSANLLSQRLRGLEQAGIVVRRKLPPPTGSRIYELTDWGYELEPVVIELGRWGSRSPSHPRDGGLSPDALALALKTDFDPAAAEGLTATYELRLDEHRFRVAVADGRIDVARGAADAPDATIETDTGALSGVIFNGEPAAGLKIDGDAEAVRRFLGLFPVPEPASG
jgi:DNA-binding HxlR family transcriptional regulator